MAMLHDSSSSRLVLPSDNTTNRRLSDSMLSRPQRHLAERSKGELSELRKWAEDVMTSRLSPLDQDPLQRSRRWALEDKADPCESQQGDESGNNSKESRALLTGQADSGVLLHPALERKPSNSLHGQMKRDDNSAHRRADQICSSTHDGLPLSSDLQPPILLRRNHVTTTKTPALKKKAHNMRLAFAPAHADFVSTEEKTPRAKTLAELSSPTWTSSTCESEDDGHVIRTPADELGPRQSKSLPSGIAPPHVLDDDIEAHLDVLGESAGDAMQTITGVTLSDRRRNPLAIDTHVAQDSSSDVSQHESSWTSFASSHKLASAPIASRPKLVHLDHNDHGSRSASYSAMDVSTSSSSRGASNLGYAPSIVSAGLEMGLGMPMASLALSSTLPGPRSSSGIKRVAAPRFSGLSARPLSMEFDSAVSQAQHGEFQFPLRNILAPSYQTSSTHPPSAAGKEATLSSEDVDLARRRTTGALHKKSDAAVGKSRIRAGTHDPSASEPAGTLRRPGLHRLTSSISTFPRLTEEDLASTLRSCGSSQDTLQPSGHLQRAEGTSISSSASDCSSISDAVASGGRGTTPMGTPAHSQKAMLSPDLTSAINRHSYMSSHAGEHELQARHRAGAGRGDLDQHVDAGMANGGLVGMGGGGHFGPGVRAKIGEILGGMIEQVPMEEEVETIQLIEFGSFNSRSAQLMQPIISLFAQRLGNIEEGCGPSFHVTHEDTSSVDFRPLMQQIENHPESYLDLQWQATHSPSLTDSIFNSFVARPFASRIAAPKSFYAGISLMDLHWLHSPLDSNVSPAERAEAELTRFLTTRAHEFRKGGVLLMAYIARGEGAGHKDVWTTLSNTLAPCIQRLVSCSMVKSDVARHLLSLPLHPRSAKETKEVLQKVCDKWEVAWSCGLGDCPSSFSSENTFSLPPSEAEPLRLPHPAWKAYKSGALSRVPYTEHMIQLFKNLYESHFRTVLRERGKLSKGAVEFVLDSLWDVLFSRIVDQEPSPINDVEMEVSIVALRRL